MKNEIILWVSSLIVLFLIGYIKNVTSKDYPVTGTFGIEGKKVSYKLDKICFDKVSYKNLIISDIKGIKARLLMQKNGQQKEIPYKEIDRGLVAEIPVSNPGEKVNYKIIISYNEETFELPKQGYISLNFWGNIPSPVSILNFILLYGGLLMSIRILFEAFTKKVHLKKFIFITCTLFITLVIIVYPLYISYKLGAINHFVPAFGDLINPLLVLILSIWIFAAVLIFNKKLIRTVTIVVVFASFLIYFFI